MKTGRASEASDPRRWNLQPGDESRAYGCDALAFRSDEAFYRAIAVRAPRELAFRWICQLRVAPYSYDWLDNFGRKSPARLVPGLDELAPGQRVMTIFEVVSFERPREITIRLRSRLGRLLMGDFAGTYAVVPDGPDGARIVAKVLLRYPRGAYGALLRVALPWLDLVMFRRQLVTLRRYVERDARA